MAEETDRILAGKATGKETGDEDARQAAVYADPANREPTGPGIRRSGQPHRFGVREWGEASEQTRDAIRHWCGENGVVLTHTYALNYNERSNMVTVHAFAVNDDGHFYWEDHRVARAPVVEIEVSRCPWE